MTDTPRHFDGIFYAPVAHITCFPKPIPAVSFLKQAVGEVEELQDGVIGSGPDGAFRLLLELLHAAGNVMPWQADG